VRCSSVITACALAAAGCTSTDIYLGPAVVTIYLGNQSELTDTVTLETGTALVFATEVYGDGIEDSDAIVGAEVTARTDGEAVPAEDIGAGTYLTDIDEASELAPGDDRLVSVSLTEAERTVGLTGPIPEVEALPFDLINVAAGDDLVVELPEGWWDDTPYVVNTLATESGQLLWTDRPERLRDWIETLADPEKPREVVVPGRVVEEGSLLFASCFLRQLDRQVTFDGPINEPFSGLWAGTAKLVSVEAR